MAELTKAKLELYVYGGSIEAVPDTPNYTLTKTRLSTETSIVFEISELIKDHITIDFNGDYGSLKQTKWVHYKVTRTYGTGDDATEDFYVVDAIAFRGYGELEDGINPQLSKDLLVSNKVVHNLCGAPLTIPFYTRGEDGVTQITYASDAAEAGNLVTGSVSPYTVAQSIHLNPSGTVITIDKTASLAANPEDSTDVAEIIDGITAIQYATSNGGTKSIEVKCIDECKNIPHKVSFINKFGVMQDIWFFAKRKDSISSQREQYKKNTLSVGATGASYNISDHQRVYLENQGRESITMNTGFIDESYNEVMKQLLVSEYVYIHDNFRLSPTNAGANLAIPISVVTNSLDFKTKRDDKLINYELQFEMDSEFIQSIR